MSCEMSHFSSLYQFCWDCLFGDPHIKIKSFYFEQIMKLWLVSMINKRTSKSKRVMQLIRPLVLVTMQYNIQFKAVHIEGINNEIADSLSRFQFQRFRKVAPKAVRYPEQIPTAFWNIITNLRF